MTRWGKSGLTSQVSPSGPEPSRFSLHQMSQGRVAGCSQELATGLPVEDILGVIA